MFYALKGRVTAAGSTPCRQEIVPGFLRLYSGKEGALPPDSNTTNNAEFGQIISESELGNLVGKMLAREPLEQDGSFHAAIDDRQYTYEGGRLQLVFELSYYKPMLAPMRGYRPVFILLGDFHPNWISIGSQFNAELDVELAAALAPKMMATFDVWCFQVQIESKAGKKLPKGTEIEIQWEGKRCFSLPISKEGNGHLLIREEDLIVNQKTPKNELDVECLKKQLAFKFLRPKQCIDIELQVQTAEIAANQSQIICHLRID